MWKKLSDFMTDPEVIYGFMIWLVVLWMISPGSAGDMFGSLFVYCILVFAACCVGLLFGPVGVGIAFWGGVALFVFTVVFHLVRAFTGWIP